MPAPPAGSPNQPSPVPVRGPNEPVVRPAWQPNFNDGGKRRKSRRGKKSRKQRRASRRRTIRGGDEFQDKLNLRLKSIPESATHTAQGTSPPPTPMSQFAQAKIDLAKQGYRGGRRHTVRMPRFTGSSL
jgi:hypothetical protein